MSPAWYPGAVLTHVWVFHHQLTSPEALGEPRRPGGPWRASQAEAGRWKTDRKTRQLYKHPQAALM